MCLDCAWLWEAFSRPIAPSSAQSMHSGEFGSSLREPDETDDERKGSTSGLPSFEDVSDVPSGDGSVVVDLLRRLSSGEIDGQRSAAKELRYLAKESPEKKILIARVGSIPLLVDLLSTRDPETQEHAVTTLLNLSIINANKVAIVRAGAVDAIVDVLMSGSMEARENAAATLFSLSVLDENKVTIGKSGAIPALVDLLRDGTMRGKSDAASALFNLSLYDDNKPKAVLAGVLPPLVKLLSDSGACLTDVSLAMLSLIATHKDCTAAIAEASAFPVLIDLIRSGSPGNKENSVVVLLALSDNDPAQAVLARQLGASSYVAELARSGIPRARRKATQLLDILNAADCDHQSTLARVSFGGNQLTTLPSSS